MDAVCENINETDRMQKNSKVKKAHTSKKKGDDENNSNSKTVSEPKVRKKRMDSEALIMKLDEVVDINDTLSKAITEKNQEIINLQRSIASLNDILHTVPIDELRTNSNNANHKVSELSKQNRQLSNELEIVKSASIRKDVTIRKLERELKKIEDKGKRNTEKIKKNMAPIEGLNVKINILQQKLFESRNRNTELQNQLKIAQKYLQQEIGDHYIPSNFLTLPPANASWRGRAQRIMNLQTKLNEMQQRILLLEQRSQISYLDSSTTLVDEEATNTNDTEKNACDNIIIEPRNRITMSINTHCSLYKSNTGKSETQLHRAKVEALEKDIEVLHIQLQETHNKMSALKVRNKTLCDDIQKYKTKILAIEQNVNYGASVASLTEQILMQKAAFEDNIREHKNVIEGMQMHINELQNKERVMLEKLEYYQDNIFKQEEEISKLKVCNKKLDNHIRDLGNGFLYSCREFQKDEFVAILDALEAEKNLLMQYNQKIHSRLTTERQNNEVLAEQALKHHARSKHLETMIIELEAKLTSMAETKKQEKRVSDYINCLNNKGSMRSLVFENRNLKSLNDNDLSRIPVKKLINELDYFTERLKILEERLKFLKIEKDSDVKLFQDIISNSRQVVLDTLLSQRDKNVAEEEQEQQHEEEEEEEENITSSPSLKTLYFNEKNNLPLRRLT